MTGVWILIIVIVIASLFWLIWSMGAVGGAADNLSQKALQEKHRREHR